YTGFKWIAREVRLNQDEGSLQYIGGGEESYGFMAEDFCRDKDAVSACCLLAEICAWAKDQGKTLYDVLMDLYLEYGFSYNKTINVVRPGKSGAEEIQAMMENFRTQGPAELAGSRVVLAKDFAALVQYADGKETPLEMPDTSNVLQWYTADGTKVSVRPSGTEPKIKFYIEVKGDMTAASDYEEACRRAEEKVKAVEKSLGL
ncbi:MAG: phospho-sugar mutase, partial [Alloprevotella sp.]|nr:phospho-sugar mutase [Alloprevotella sp.]